MRCLPRLVLLLPTSVWHASFSIQDGLGSVSEILFIDVNEIRFLLFGVFELLRHGSSCLETAASAISFHVMEYQNTQCHFNAMPNFATMPCHTHTLALAFGRSVRNESIFSTQHRMTCSASDPFAIHIYIYIELLSAAGFNP